MLKCLDDTTLTCNTLIADIQKEVSDLETKYTYLESENKFTYVTVGYVLSSCGKLLR